MKFHHIEAPSQILVFLAFVGNPHTSAFPLSFIPQLREQNAYSIDTEQQQGLAISVLMVRRESDINVMDPEDTGQVPSQSPSHYFTRRSFSYVSSAAAISLALPQSSTCAASEISFGDSGDPPLVTLLNGLAIPAVGYGLYKTPFSQSYRGTTIALCKANVRYFDTAMAYGNAAEVGRAIKDIGGVFPTRYMGLSDKESPKLRDRRIGRKDLFLATKVDNASQSANAAAVRRSVLDHLRIMKMSYVDMCSVHSPLTDKSRRLGTYAALCDLVKEGIVRSVGVCNYGVQALDEIVSAGLPLPAVNQLELSPFNQHKDVVDWADSYGMKLSCAPWSKLSGATGPQDGWAKLSAMAKSRNATKAQILVRWSLQKGYICVPRSGTSSKVERMAIIENSGYGVKDLVLNNDEMKILDSLDVQWKAGTLGRRDGWSDDDVKSSQWEPTDYV